MVRTNQAFNGHWVHSHGTHGRDIETEQTTAHDGDGRDDVNISDLIHSDDIAVLQPQSCARRSVEHQSKRKDNRAQILVEE